MVCLILLALLGVAKKQALEARNAQLKREVAKLSMDILGKENTEISALTQALEEDFTADFSAIPPRSVTELLYEISDKLDPELVIDVDRLEINLERKSLVMQGKTPKPSDVETLTDTLEKMSCFRDVQQERVEAAGENTAVQKALRQRHAFKEVPHETVCMAWRHLTAYPQEKKPSLALLQSRLSRP